MGIRSISCFVSPTQQLDWPVLTLLLVLAFALPASAHPGRLDKNGGHNCSEASKAKGLCTGYQYHNGTGSGDSSGSSGSSGNSG